MSRVVYIAEIDPREVAALAYVAGLLQGQGVAQGQIIAEILDRIQLVEVPDDFTGIEDQPDAEAPENVVEENSWESEGGTVLDFPQPVNDEGEELSADLPPIDVATDPTAPENLGIQLNLPAPPPPPPPMGHPDDFGAGPPPRKGG